MFLVVTILNLYHLSLINTDDTDQTIFEEHLASQFVCET